MALRRSLHDYASGDYSPPQPRVGQVRGGADPLLAIEYGFHVNLMIVGGIPAAFFMKGVGKRA